MTVHTNSEGERIEVREVTAGRFAGQHVLIVHDDPPPAGTATEAPTLLDAGTAAWLRAELDLIHPREPVT